MIRSEPDRLGDIDLVRVIDALGVRKGFDGEVEVLQDSQLGPGLVEARPCEPEPNPKGARGNGGLSQRVVRCTEAAGPIGAVAAALMAGRRF